MKLKILVLITILCTAVLIPISASADEIYLQTWQELDYIAQIRNREERGLVPNRIKPVSSKEGVYQQVLDYHLRAARENTVVRTFNTTWTSQVPEAKEVGPKFEMKPLQTKASLDFKGRLKAALNYNVWNRNAELQILPVAKILGMSVALSHVNAPSDQQSRLIVKMEW